jgi:hypothetical protein
VLIFLEHKRISIYIPKTQSISRDSPVKTGN